MPDSTFELEIDIVYADDNWPTSLEGNNIDSVIVKALHGAIAKTCVDFAAPSEICIVLNNDSQQRDLNQKWRGIDRPTNVLSFPQIEVFSTPCGMLGDIVLARQTVMQEAVDQKKSLLNHLSHLVVHGFLHILGYDHKTDKQAKQMESLEIDILADLGIMDPYRD